MLENQNKFYLLSHHLSRITCGCVQNTAAGAKKLVRNDQHIYGFIDQKCILDLDACFVGVPFDSGTSYRPGSRLGPRQIRSESIMVSNYNIGTGNSL